MRYVVALLSLSCALIGTATHAGAAILMDFEEYVHGKVIDNQYLASEGVKISGRNFTAGPDLAIIFDSRKTGTADLDLEDAWTGGNLKGSTASGNILILAKNETDANGDGLIDSPDNQGSASRSSGELRFRFASMQDSIALDLIDVDGPQEGAIGFFGFNVGGVEKARVRFSAFVDPNSRFYDPTFEYGDRFANRIAPITAADLGIAGFDELVMNTGLCSAVDGMRFEAVQPVPEPSAAAIAGAGFIATILGRRTRRWNRRDDRNKQPTGRAVLRRSGQPPQLR